MTSLPASPQSAASPSSGRPQPNLLARLLDGLLHVFDLLMGPLQRRIGIRGMAYLFVLPNLLIFGIFILFPTILNVHYAVTGGTKIFPADRPFVGLENFQVLFDCEDFLNPNTCREDIFWRAASNTFIFVITQVGGLVVLALITALALNQRIKARGFFRGIFFYPVLLSPVVVGLIWKWILQRDGVLNAIIVALGGERMPFLLNADWARFWVVIVSIWAQMGFYTLILLAGLQSIPAELYEAGQIDGASPWKSFRFITLPLLMPTLLVVMVLSLIRAVQVFDQPYVLTGGGPGTATNYIVQYIYATGFDPNVPQYGLAATASVVLAVVLFILTMGQLRLGRNTDYS